MEQKNFLVEFQPDGSFEITEVGEVVFVATHDSFTIHLHLNNGVAGIHVMNTEVFPPGDMVNQIIDAVIARL